MILNIFRLNWILIDLVIIALLIIVLISLKWFKLKFRWRKDLSNEALELLNFDFSEIGIQNQHIIVKKAFYLKNKNLEDKSKLIIFLFPKQKRKLLYILTEGLASYGCTVVILNVKFKIKNNKNHEQISKEIKNLLLNISNYFIKEEGLPIGFNCSLISFYSFISLNYLIDSDPNILRLILINPNLKKKYFKKIDDKENLNPKSSLKIYFIFSEKSSFFLNNQYLKNYLNRNSREHAKLLYLKTIEKAKASFKYYETILLGILIDIIKKKSS